MTIFSFTFSTAAFIKATMIPAADALTFRSCVETYAVPCGLVAGAMGVASWLKARWGVS